MSTSNVLKYQLTDGSWLCLLASGTEPKAKFYFGVKELSVEQSLEKLAAIQTGVMDLVNDSLASKV